MPKPTEYAAGLLSAAKEKEHQVLQDFAATPPTASVYDVLHARGVVAGAELVVAAAQARNPFNALSMRLRDSLLLEPTTNVYSEYTRAVKHQTVVLALPHMKVR